MHSIIKYNFFWLAKLHCIQIVILQRNDSRPRLSEHEVCASTIIYDHPGNYIGVFVKSVKPAC